MDCHFERSEKSSFVHRSSSLMRRGPPASFLRKQEFGRGGFQTRPYTTRERDHASLAGINSLGFDAVGFLSIKYRCTRNFDHAIGIVKLRHLYERDRREVLAENLRVSGAERLLVG